MRGASTSEASPEQTVEHVKVKGSPVISGGGGGNLKREERARIRIFEFYMTRAERKILDPLTPPSLQEGWLFVGSDMFTAPLTINIPRAI